VGCRVRACPPPPQRGDQRVEAGEDDVRGRARALVPRKVDVRVKLPWREAGPLNHHDDIVDSDQQVVNNSLSWYPSIFPTVEPFGAGARPRSGPASSVRTNLPKRENLY